MCRQRATPGGGVDENGHAGTSLHIAGTATPPGAAPVLGEAILWYTSSGDSYIQIEGLNIDAQRYPNLEPYIQIFFDSIPTDDYNNLAAFLEFEDGSTRKTKTAHFDYDENGTVEKLSIDAYSKKAIRMIRIGVYQPHASASGPVRFALGVDNLTITTSALDPPVQLGIPGHSDRKLGLFLDTSQHGDTG